MGTLCYLVIHCLETPKGRFILPTDIDDWHRSPLKNPDGTITYLGKKYKTLSDAPISAKHKGKWGRGWDRLGYTGYFQPNGEFVLLTPHNEDTKVDDNEMTWGATGVNAISRHIAYAGGSGKFGLNNLTDEQFMALQMYTKNFIRMHPNTKIAGHNHFAIKKCPNFYTDEFCNLIGIPQHNILAYEKKTY